MRATLEKLLRRENLGRHEAGDLLSALTSGETEPAMAGAILAALRTKGETAEEIAGFAERMRSLAKRPLLPSGQGPLVDIVGTGGDGSSSYNLSTGAALLAAACGLRVAKHGNRAVSSACGSADVLLALGLQIPMREESVASCLREAGFTFLFAPEYHPAMAAVAPVRRSLGVRTIFNMLGPLTNPAAPECGVIGAHSAAAARLMAQALSSLPIWRYFVVHSETGWDEPTPAGPFLLLDVRPGLVSEQSRDPADYGMARCGVDELRGGCPRTNAAALRETLLGKPGPLADALALGAALALEVAGGARSLQEGMKLARKAIEAGEPARVLERLRTISQRVSEATGEPVHA